MNLTRVFKNSVKSLDEKLFEHITPYEIYCNLIGFEVEVGDFILSPIRTDKKPTFALFVPENEDKILFKDFAWVGGDVFKFIKLYAIYQDGKTLNNRYEIIEYLDKKLGLGILNKNNKFNTTLIRKKIDLSFFASKRVINFTSRNFTEKDISYWNKYHITEKTLKYYNVKSVKKLLNENNEVIYTVSQQTLTFAFVIYNKIKLYSPNAGEFKWRNTCPGHYLQGIEQVTKNKSKNKKLIITKSLKDIMVFHTFLKDEYDIIAPHSETYNFTDREIQWMKSNYDEVIIIFDYDLAGVTGANKLRKRDIDLFKVMFVSVVRFKINGKIKVIDKDISDYAFNRPIKDIITRLKCMGL